MSSVQMIMGVMGVAILILTALTLANIWMLKDLWSCVEKWKKDERYFTIQIGSLIDSNAVLEDHIRVLQGKEPNWVAGKRMRHSQDVHARREAGEDI